MERDTGRRPPVQTACNPGLRQCAPLSPFPLCVRPSLPKRDVDMLHSPLIHAILQFTLPLVLSGTLQLLFSAADMIVVGHFYCSTALPAVCSTSSLMALFTNFFIGMSVGACDRETIENGVHTSVAVSAIRGLCFWARGMLEWVGSPADVIDQTSLHLRIYFLGMPFSMMYNFAAAILHAVGDSSHPTLYLTELSTCS